MNDNTDPMIQAMLNSPGKGEYGGGEPAPATLTAKGITSSPESRRGEPLLSLPCNNTDREIWREREGDAYADSIHVTANGGIGINCGGTVFVKPVREWFKLAKMDANPLMVVNEDGTISPLDHRRR